MEVLVLRAVAEQAQAVVDLWKRLDPQETPLDLRDAFVKLDTRLDILAVIRAGQKK